MNCVFWVNLTSACNEARISVSALCDRLGISRSMVTKWRNGSVPRVDTLGRISDELGIAPQVLLGEVPPTPTDEDYHEPQVKTNQNAQLFNALSLLTDNELEKLTDYALLSPQI